MWLLSVKPPHVVIKWNWNPILFYESPCSYLAFLQKYLHFAHSFTFSHGMFRFSRGIFMTVQGCATTWCNLPFCTSSPRSAREVDFFARLYTIEYLYIYIHISTTLYIYIYDYICVYIYIVNSIYIYIYTVYIIYIYIHVRFYLQFDVLLFVYSFGDRYCLYLFLLFIYIYIYITLHCIYGFWYRIHHWWMWLNNVVGGQKIWLSYMGFCQNLGHQSGFVRKRLRGKTDPSFWAVHVLHVLCMNANIMSSWG